MGSIIQRVLVQPDGKIIVGGAFQSLRGLRRSYIGRLTSTGFVDPTFYANPNGPVSAIALHGT